MNWKFLQQRSWLNLLSAIILMAGVGSAAWIYQRAANNAYGALGYEVADGTVYPIMPENSKIYRHNLEVFGGKFAVVMDDFRRWFLGLGHGKSLAFIIFCTTIIISFGFFYKANYFKPRLQSDGDNENNPDRTS
jgi:di/tricarboxylate transporter